MGTDGTELDPEARCAIRRRLSEGMAVRARPADLLDVVLEACRPGADGVLAAPVQRRLAALRARVLAGRPDPLAAQGIASRGQVVPRAHG